MISSFSQFRQSVPQRFGIGNLIKFMTEAMQLARIADCFDFSAELNTWKTFVSEQANMINFPYHRGFQSFLASFLAP
ncbi:MAG: hypothetical protein ACREAB_15405, partial [Blastocatellia bacterium]